MIKTKKGGVTPLFYECIDGTLLRGSWKKMGKKGVTGWRDSLKKFKKPVIFF